ncbi:amidohydrolase [Humibacter albus]|uniref:amidohydrolase n=1 Tax=Humibacter albus TaxID=427754 RepID=UPI0003B6531F|nr:amidohydrolase [Humibacter albus]
MTDTERIVADYEAVRGDQEALYRDLHEHPELSHQETRTAEKVIDGLRTWGFDVVDGVGGTGVVGVLANGAGPTVLLRADMDALPVEEDTGVPYASTQVATDAAGARVPVMHACGHDVHVASLMGAARLMASHTDLWHGTLLALFQPAEETGDGARGMVDDHLFDRVPHPDVALAQHVLPGPTGHVGVRNGAVLSTAQSMRVTVYGRGGHGSMPQNTIDPVVLAAMIVVRLQVLVSRETAPTDPAVLTVGSLRAGTKSNIIPDTAVLELNVRAYSAETMARLLDGIERVVRAECEASGCPREPEIERFGAFPITENDSETTERIEEAFRDLFGDSVGILDLQTASEDFSDLPNALGIPYSYWGLGGIDTATWDKAVAAGRVLEDIPVNHSPKFLPVMQPTLKTGTSALVAAAMSYLGKEA